MDYRTYETHAKLIDILQLIPETEMVTVRCDELGKGIHYVTLRPRQLAVEKKEWLWCEVYSVTRAFTEYNTIEIGIMYY
ncbi:hypothetical protein NNG48_07270 [Enterococcus faecium]|nr:hypothetical protein [Enterococcus faecium]